MHVCMYVCLYVCTYVYMCVGMNGAVARAEQIEASTPGSVMLQQFNNGDNPKVHRSGPQTALLSLTSCMNICMYVCM